jgi:Zn-dependent protease
VNTGFFKKQISVARVYGIPVQIDYRWFIVFGLSVWLIATDLQKNALQLGTMRLPPVEPVTAWILGVSTTIALFAAVFGHELSHAVMARAEGIEIIEIVLHPFGGLARLRREPDSPGAEFRIAIAGPAASFVFGILGIAATKVASLGGYQAATVLFFLFGCFNILLAVFNLFPGYPLDGGRVLRAILWRKTGNMAEATRMAGICGLLIAGTLIAFGVYMAGTWAFLMGLWSVLVGLFLLDAAASVVRHSGMVRQSIVAETMAPPFAIEPDLLLSQFVDSVLPLHRQTSFPVAFNRRLHGILTLQDLKDVPRERWREKRARDVMRPVGPLLFVDPSATIAFANNLMRRNGTGSLAVINTAGELVGFLQQQRK